MEQSINGKVAGIVNDTTLVLNIGSEQGVAAGMVFAVFAEHQEVVDPDTGQPLGRWEVVKAHVVVTHVQEKISTVRSFVERREGRESSAPLSTLMVEHSRGHYGSSRDSDRQRLEVNSVEVAGTPQTSPIAVGDKVRYTGQSEANAPA